MATLASTLTTPRYYTQADPYFYTVDNRPLTDLAANDVLVSNRVDAISLGRVDISGAASPTTNSAPPGWTVARTSAGLYVVTHNLGIAITAYSVQVTCMPLSTTPYVGFITAMTTNSFTVSTVTLANVATDIRFVCSLTQF